MSPNSAGKNMSVSTNAIDLGAPTASWLRTRGYSAKHVARVIDASEGTGKRLRAGAAPTPEQMAKLSLHFGWDFVKHVFEAIIGPDREGGLSAIERRLARLEEMYEAERQSVVAASPALAFLAPPRIGPSMGEPEAP